MSGKRIAIIFLVSVMTCITVFTAKNTDFTDEDSQFVEINDLSVHYNLFGEETDTLFLMLHGFGSSTFTWSFVQEDLANRGTVLAYDRPAFGLTERVPKIKDFDYNPYDFYYQSELAKALIEELGFEDKELIIIGHSAGTPVALDFYDQYPEKVKGLVLIAPALFHYLDENPFARFIKNPILRATASLFKGALANRLEEGLDESWYDPSKITPELREEYKKFTKIDDWDKALFEFTLNQGDFNMEPVLEKVDVPTLVIMGKYDAVIDDKEIETLVSDNDLIDYYLIDETGHVPHEETPDEVSAIIEGWLESIIE